MNHIARLHRRLEFDKVLSLLRQKSASDYAASMFDDLPFMTAQPEIEQELARVMELKEMLANDAAFPLEIHEIKQDLKVAAVPGNFLTCAGLLRIAGTLRTSRRVHAFLKKRQQTYPNLWQVACALNYLKETETAITDKIDAHASEVRSSATPELARLRKQIQASEQKARKTLEAMFKRMSDKGYLQESVITLREGRLVFPVKAENRGKIRGLVHDQSASGATFFMEPLESIELNNEIQSLKMQEQREVERILRDLTGQVAAELEAIVQNLSVLVRFDFLQAKARFAIEFDCNAPSFSRENVLHILAGKHPLLLHHKKDGQQVVPLDLTLDENSNTLIITGPNAGGKSVALKTVGLLAVMAQSGIPIPAYPDTKLPVFSAVFADIGDYQSIEHDLSTFTSHIQNIHRIVTAADSRSLVLLDEIGVGTDPDEGAALAIALLESLTQRGCKTIVTTHHGSLKAFAYNTHGVENGSMEFDIETLQPTFRFKAGVPGSSYALEICRRLGLPEPILARSRELVGSEKHKLESLILELDRKTQAAERLSRSLDIEKTRLKALTRLYQEKVDSFKKEEKALRKKALQESQQIIERSNALVEQAIRDIKEKQAQRETVGDYREQLQNERRKITEKLDRLSGPMVEAAEQEAPDIGVGNEVLWRDQNKVGKIVAIQDSGEKVLLQMGALKVWVPVTELARAKPSRKKQPERRASVHLQTETKDEVLPEIDVRGQI